MHDMFLFFILKLLKIRGGLRMIKQNVIRTSLIFAISATIFSHYSYAETSSNIESEDVDQKVNLQKTSDTQHSKIELSNENQNIKEFNHTNDETSNTEESQQESNETNSKEESKTEESQQESNETNSKEESKAEESQQESNETNKPEEPKTEKAHETNKETDSIEEPKKEKVNDKNQQKSGIEHIHKNNTSSSEEKNHNKYKTAQKSKNYKNEDSTIFKQEEHQNVMSKSMKSKQNQIIQPYNDNTSSNVYSNTNYQKGKSQNSVSKTMFNQLFSRQLVENNHNNFEPTHLKQNNLYFQSDRRKESTYPSIYQIESRFSENILNRFNQYAKGAYKYNPYIINKVNHLDDNGEKITNKDFNRLIKKQKFDNQNLNILQEDSQYFRFQYFNPLNAKEYYKNLDEQVLSLITNDIGSMPDLKKPKTIHKDEVEEEQHKKVITSSHKKTESKSYIKTLNMILIPTLILISSTVMIIYVYQKLKTKKK